MKIAKSEEKMRKVDTIEKLEGLPPPPNKIRWLTTIAILFGNLTFGCAFQFYNPALEDMRIKYNTSMEQISVIFTIILVSYCVGALSSGVIYNYINRQLGVIICLGGMATALYVTPYCPTKIMFFITGSSLGYFIGGYDAAQVVWIIEMWRDEAGPFIQAQHFCYAMGTFAGPLIMAPFLNRDRDAQHTQKSDLSIPCSIGGAMSTAACLLQIFLFTFYRYKPTFVLNIFDKNDNLQIAEVYHSALDLEYNKGEKETFSKKKPKEADIDEDFESEYSDTDGLSKVGGIVIEASDVEKQDLQELICGVRKSSKLKTAALTIATGVFFGAYQGMELSTMQFMPTYAQYSNLELSESQSALVLTAMTGAFTIGRFLGIFIIMKVPPLVMLFISLAMVIGGNCILLFWAWHDMAMLWTGAILLGAAYSTMYASFCAFIMKHLTVTNSIGSFIIVSGSTLAAVYPLIIGGKIAENVVALTYTNFFSIAACTMSMTLSFLLTRR